MEYESERDGVPLVEEEDAAGVRQDDSKVDALLDDENDEEIISIFSTADKRRLFVVEDIIKACAGCRPSFLFTGYVIEQPPGTSLPSSYRLTPKEKTIERDLTLSLRYELPSPKFSRSCPTSTSYRLKVRARSSGTRSLSTLAAKILEPRPPAHAFLLPPLTTKPRTSPLLSFLVSGVQRKRFSVPDPGLDEKDSSEQVGARRDLGQSRARLCEH